MKRPFSPLAILTVGWAVFVIHAFPGLMNADSIAELADARRGVFAAGGEPASVPALWSVLDQLISGPFGMLALGSLLFLGGAYLVGQRCSLSQRQAAWVAAIVLITPPVLAGMAVAGGHALFAGSALLGLGLVLGDRPRVRALGCVLLALAAATRYGGFAATLPMVFAMPMLGERWRQRGVALGIWVGTVTAAFAINAVVEDRDHAVLAVDDIAGTLAHAPPLEPVELRNSLVDAGLIEYYPQVVARNNYKASARGALAAPNTLFVDATTSDQTATLQRARRELTSDHPGAYIHHRFATFATILGFGWSPPLLRANQPIDGLRALEIPTGNGRVQELTDRAIEGVSFALAPWLYVLLTIAILIRLRRDFELRVLLASGLAMEIVELYYAADGDYLRSHWMITTSVLALAIAIARGLQRKTA